MFVAAMLSATMVLLVGMAREALAGLLTATDDPVGEAEARSDWLPDAMPLPAGATVTFVLPTRSGDMATYAYVRRPVAEVLADLEGRFERDGWAIAGRSTGTTWPDDHLFRVEGHGQAWIVHVQPSVGSPTETTIIYARD
jgi:hypothetical protein